MGAESIRHIKIENTSEFICHSLTAALHNYPYLFPYMQELAGFDKAVFKHSISVAEVAAQAFSKYALEAHVPKDVFEHAITTLALGGFIHDIGKAGLNRFGMFESLEDLRPEDYRGAHTKLLIPGQDRRSADERAIIHNHPIIGGYMVRNLCNELPIPKHMASDISDFAFSHHEKPADLIGTHNSYSRVSTLRKKYSAALLHTLLSLSDIAVSMREPRAYREFASLPLSAIFDELKKELSDDLITSIFGVQSNKDLIREKMVGYVLSSVQGMDHMLTDRDYNIEGMRINGSEWHSVPIEKAVLIPRLVSDVWNNPKYERRFLSTLEKDIKNTWVHTGRP